MVLPKIETPSYELDLPSQNEKVKYRPFTVKEEKILLIANESKNNDEILNATMNVLESCTFNKLNVRSLPLFDIEYIFLKIRAKSVGESITVNVTCPDDKETKVEKEIKIDDIKVSVFDDHTNEVEITDNIKMVFDYPLLSSFSKYGNSKQSEMTFTVINDCIKEIHHGDEIHNRKDMTEKELSEFIDSLNTEQFEKVMGFFKTMPKIRHVLEVENPKTKVKSEVALEGIRSFLV